MSSGNTWESARQSPSGTTVEQILLTTVRQRERDLLNKIADLNKNLENQQNSLFSYKDQLKLIESKMTKVKSESITSIERTLNLLEKNIFNDSKNTTQELLLHLKNSVANNYFKMMNELKEQLETSQESLDFSFVRKYFQNITLEYNVGLPNDFHNKAQRYEEFINKEFYKIKDELNKSNKKIEELTESLKEAQEKIDRQSEELLNISKTTSTLTTEKDQAQVDEIDMKLMNIDKKIKETEEHVKKEGKY
jgi:chromosome segregation ATPase